MSDKSFETFLDKKTDVQTINQMRCHSVQAIDIKT